jgi:hypothetical protein
MRDQNFPLELENLWKRSWLPAIVALAVIIALGLCFMSVLCAYTKSHSAYLSNASVMSLQAEFK